MLENRNRCGACGAWKYDWELFWNEVRGTWLCRFCRPRDERKEG